MHSLTYLLTYINNADQQAHPNLTLRTILIVYNA